jgi:hypothetical protein
MPPPETFQGTQAALVEANKLCELAAARLADLEALLEEVRTNRDYWKEQAEQWQEQAQWLALPWWERAALRAHKRWHRGRHDATQLGTVRYGTRAYPNISGKGPMAIPSDGTHSPLARHPGGHSGILSLGRAGRAGLQSAAAAVRDGLARVWGTVLVHLAQRSAAGRPSPIGPRAPAAPWGADEETAAAQRLCGDEPCNGTLVPGVPKPGHLAAGQASVGTRHWV